MTTIGRTVARVGAPTYRRASAAPRAGQRVSDRLAKWAGDESPWSMRDILRLAWMVGAGAVGMGVCWYGISGQSSFHDQIGWFVGAVAALALGCFGMVGFLLSGIREVHAETFDLVTRIRTERLHEVVGGFDSEFDGDVDVAPVDVSDGYVIGPAMTRVHRADCPHVQGKAVGAISTDDIERLGLSKCGVCCA